MRHHVAVDCLDCRRRLFRGADTEQSATTWEAAAETRVLHDYRPAACQIGRGAIAEPSRVSLDKDVLAYAELTLRTCNVARKCTKEESPVGRVAPAPAGNRNWRGRTVPPPTCYFHRARLPRRKIDKLPNSRGFPAIFHAVPLH